MDTKSYFIFRNKPTEIRLGDFAKIDTEFGTIALTRDGERIYTREREDKVYIGPLGSLDPATIVAEVTGLTPILIEENNNCLIYELTTSIN